jgi:hypothetical protein
VIRLLSPSVTGVTAHYERLRSAALGRKDEMGTAPGMTVLLRNGLAAWLGTLLFRPAAVVDEPPMGAVPVGGADATTGTSPSSAGDCRAEFARVLAGMILAQHSEVHQ